MQGVVFKQRYKSVSNRASSVLNQKHLEYVATRKGVIKNPGCGFGLWGRFPGQYRIENMENLQKVKKVIGKISKSKTVYRAILSVDDETAKAKGLYERSNWDKLLKERILCIPKEMGIEPKNFCWCASMHYKKGHPHVHILYWDNGNDPRPEYIPPERFEKISEKIRAGFNRGIFESELKVVQNEQKVLESTFRLGLAQWITEANPYDVLNLDTISQKRLDKATKMLVDLIRFAPSRGSLKYQYLKEDYKEKVDAFVNVLLEMPGFEAQKARFLELSDEVSRLYGNSPQTIQQNRENQSRRLHKSLANEALKAVADCLRQIQREQQYEMNDAEFPQLEENIVKTTCQILSCDPDFEQLLHHLPTLRTPFHAWDESQKKELENLVQKVWTDVRVKGQIKEFLAQKNLKEEEKKEIFSNVGKILRSTVWSQVTEQKGYTYQLAASRITTLLIHCFRLTSQHRNQMGTQCDLMKKKSCNMSREQRKEQAARMAQAGSWEMEL